MDKRKTILLSIVLVLSLVGGVGLWWIVSRSGKPVPGTRFFHTDFDESHGMATTTGTFEFAGGEKIYLDCWSPGTLMRDHFVKFLIYRPSHRIPEMKDSLTGAERYAELKDTLTIKAGNTVFSFDGDYGDPKYESIVPGQDRTFYPNYDMTREQLREVVSAHQVEFDIGKETPLTLSEDQLADIRAFLAYTDKLPEYDPRPPEMRTNPP